MNLQEAEAVAVRLFERIKPMVQPGLMESELNQKIFELCVEEFGTKTHWHKRLVRAGKNTLCPYDDNPADLRIQEDDMVFVDLGPVFEEWEADFGRSYVMGNDPEKQALVDAGEDCFHIAKSHFQENPEITSEALFAFVESLAKERGYQMGSWHTGHRIGKFPHERPPEKVDNFIMPGNTKPLDGDWILEIHFTNGDVGSFFEQLLT